MSKKGLRKVTETLQKEDVIQAVVIADDFTSNFNPVALKKPTCLIPLVNTPIIDYTLEFLALGGVQEVIIFCSMHADAVKEHIRKSSWSNPESPLTVNIIISETCHSFGDAMRDLDAKAVIKGDFILLFGYTVGNFKLLPILEKHRNFQKFDKGAAMTLIYKEACPKHMSRSPDDGTILVVDPVTSRILYHQKQTMYNKVVKFPADAVIDRNWIDILSNMLDTHIAICSVSVPPLFSDNFDFQSREDFVRGLLLNEEILGSTIYHHKLEFDEYAACVHNWFMYKAISNNVINRWTYPLVPDTWSVIGESPYTYQRHNVYRQKGVSLSKGCKLQTDIVLAKGTTVGENSVLSYCVIGHNCTIGKRVEIEHSYIFDGTVIEDDCKIIKCVLDSKVTVKARSIITKCIVGREVEIKPESDINGINLVSTNKILKDSLGHNKDSGLKQLGKKAYIYQSSGSESDEENEISGIMKSKESDELPYITDLHDFSGSENLSGHQSPDLDDANHFFTEVMDSLARGFEEKLNCDNLILEINSSRYAYNVSMQDVNYHVIRAILSLPSSGNSKLDYFNSLRAHLNYFLPILQNYVKSEEAQLDCLSAIQDTASVLEDVLSCAQKLLHFLYDRELLEEEVIIEWHKNQKGISASATKLREQIVPFIKWLEEADEESESGTDD